MNRQGRNEEKQRSAGDRGQWASKKEYILVIAGNVVGLGNVWRFPYLCYKNGGGAFLVPYVLFAVVCGIPLFLLETSMGQYTQEGFITGWRMLCPLAKGVGYGSLIIKIYDLGYIIVQVWALFYLVPSFQSQVPWATCNNTWNTENCVSLQDSVSPSTNLTSGQTTLKNLTSAATEFWERRMLGMSAGIEELGAVRWDLALCLLACWVFCFFSVWKGVQSSGKVAYFTATLPYVMLLILLVRGLTLPGASEGIYFYLYPNIRDLAKLEVWIEAGSQVCFSYSLAIGTLNVLGSYNKYNNNCYNRLECHRTNQRPLRRKRRGYSQGLTGTKNRKLLLAYKRWRLQRRCCSLFSKTLSGFTRRETDRVFVQSPAEDPAWRRRKIQEEKETMTELNTNAASVEI